MFHLLAPLPWTVSTSFPPKKHRSRRLLAPMATAMAHVGRAFAAPVARGTLSDGLTGTSWILGKDRFTGVGRVVTTHGIGCGLVSFSRGRVNGDASRLKGDAVRMKGIRTTCIDPRRAPGGKREDRLSSLRREGTKPSNRPRFETGSNPNEVVSRFSNQKKVFIEKIIGAAIVDGGSGETGQQGRASAHESSAPARSRPSCRKKVVGTKWTRHLSSPSRSHFEMERMRQTWKRMVSVNLHKPNRRQSERHPPSCAWPCLRIVTRH